MNADQDTELEISRLKACIAEVYAQRERIKRELETGVLAPSAGFIQLNETDRLLSDLDTRFKALWDAAQQGKPAIHPATQGAHDTPGAKLDKETSGGYTALESASTLPV